MKTGFALLLLAAVLAGCTTRSKAEMQGRLAFLEGQNAALKLQAGAGPGVTVKGAVQNHFVPWVSGLTLAQAIATANYIGGSEPTQIILTHEGESAALDAKLLLDGPPIPLLPGDGIELR